MISKISKFNKLLFLIKIASKRVTLLKNAQMCLRAAVKSGDGGREIRGRFLSIDFLTFKNAKN